MRGALVSAASLLTAGALVACGGRAALQLRAAQAEGVADVLVAEEQGPRTLVVELVLDPARVLFDGPAGQAPAYVEVALQREELGVPGPVLASLRLALPLDASRPLRFRNLRSNALYLLQGAACAEDGTVLSDPARSQARIVTGRSLVEDKLRLKVVLLDRIFAASGLVSLDLIGSRERSGLRGVVSWLAGDPGLYNTPDSAIEGPDGSVYVSDAELHCVFRYTGTGERLVVAGSGQAGLRDGPADQAMFNEPRALALAPGGDLLVADAGNHCIRRISREGRVSTLAGDGTSGLREGDGPQARFSYPRGLAVAPDGVVYVADTRNHRIRRISSSGAVSTLAGLVSGYLDGSTGLALFNQPSGLAHDGKADELVVADAGNNRVRRITRQGKVRTEATLAAAFRNPRGVAVDADGTVVVADTGNHRICRISPPRRTQTLAGGTAGHRDGELGVARFNRPMGLSLTSRRDMLVVDVGNRSLRRITAAGLVSTLGPPSGVPADGTGLAARFLQPAGLSVAADGRIAVADEAHHVIRVVGTDGRVATLAGRGGPGSGDGSSLEAAFRNPCDVTTDRKGGWIVADAGNGLLRRIAPDGKVTNMLKPSTGLFGCLTPAPRPGIPTLLTPSGVVVAPNGDVVVADRGRHSIYRVTSSGTITRVAGTGQAGFADGRGARARFSFPAGLAIDATGVIYVADAGNHCIRRIDPGGDVRTLAGAQQAGHVDAGGRDARFSNPLRLSLGDDGALLVADAGNHAIRRVQRDGSVTTVAGGGAGGFRDASGTEARFRSPAGVAWLGPDEVLVADSGNRCLRLLR
ncbi:MAG: hypothetical protein VKS61_03080 [Candidatus Sericytochromatia bacterium]|nr:hypothetical protein [Candidatus Sericytochromatia bacterium]